MKLSLAALGMIAAAQAATVPSAPWSTLTPTATYADATTDYPSSFGIQIETVSVSSSSAAAAKRDVVNQIGDGQIQKQTSETLSTPAATTTASVVNQIGDGQIQHQTASTTITTASVVNQIGDGQIQHQTASSTTTASVVNQIGDGQIQHQTASTASAVNQIGDGQIQNQNATTTATPTASGVSQISDGQIQATSAADDDSWTHTVACRGANALAMTLESSMLTDSAGRVGAIVANRQFQFDGPPPQAGSIYAAGWSITEDGYLALGDSDIFYQCQSGDFYNLYDENIAAQCEAVKLAIIDFVEC